MRDMSFRMFLTLLALFGRAHCFDEISEFRIVSGRIASTLEFPYMAEILKRNIHWCGGSIIHKFFILTAAHCLCEDSEIAPISLYKALVGNDEKLKGVEYDIREFIVHEEYDNQAKIDEHDIGLIRLRRAMRFNDRVQPVSLARMTPEPGEAGWVIGFGKTRASRMMARGHLRAVKLPVIGLNECRKIIPLVAKDMICAGEKRGSGDACQGDSGGPYVIGDHQVGVVAWGIGCGREGLPGVYTNVAYYKNWIESRIFE